MAYRCVATSVAGFVQQVAVAYVGHGYWFYVTGRVPDSKDPASVDRKIIRQYGINVSKWARCRRKKTGQARVQYLRFGRFFVILATHGEHPFFTAEGDQIRDIRREPLRFMGYAIGCRQARDSQVWHPSVRIERGRFRDLKARFGAMATKCSIEELFRELRRVDYEPYAPVRDQLRVLLRRTNRRRKAAGLELVPRSALRLFRSPVKPFECPD
ncbi:MAG: hypothetical protein AB9869_24970 [Verrucomicrobiia bacterium]